MPLTPNQLTPRLGEESAARTVKLKSLDQLPSRGRIQHIGYIQSVTYSAPGTAPMLSAVVVDRLGGTVGSRSGTVAHVRLRFMGQKQVPGLRPGVKIEYAGMVALVDQIPTMYNPRYVIVPVKRT